jgi:hypothetical protein
VDGATAQQLLIALRLGKKESIAFKMNTWKFVLMGLSLLGLPVVAPAQFTFTTNADSTITITGYVGSDGSVAIPSTVGYLAVTGIGDWAFYASSVTNVLVSDSVINIGDGAFFDCQSLTNVTLGSSVTNIGDWTFGFCTNLISVCCRGNAPSLGSGNVFYGNQATVYYLSGTTNWGPTFAGQPSVLWNPPVPYSYNAYYNNSITITRYTGSNSVATIPDTIDFLPVTRIWDSAFAYCSNLTGVTIPDGVTELGDFSFTYCTSLASIMLPDSVRSIGAHAFDSCSNLTSVTIPDGVTGIGSAAFYNCTSLTFITIPASVTDILSYAFSFCTNLKGVFFNGNAPVFGDDSIFYNSPHAAAYYLIGKTGWDSPFLWWCPKMLWDPQMSISNGSSGGQANPFGFTINGAYNLPVVVEACTNLANPNWQPMQTNTLTTGTAYFSDPQWTNYPSRFYHLRSP